MDTILSILEELFKDTSWGYNITCLIIVIACYRVLVDIIAYVATVITIVAIGVADNGYWGLD